MDSLFPIQSLGMEKAKELSKAEGVDGISLGSFEAQILSWIVSSFEMKKFVEIGTLSGFSGLAILNSLKQGGTLWTFEKDSKRAQSAQILLMAEAEKIKKAVHLIEGDAQLKLPEIEQFGPFDGIFIDGNKSAYGQYLQWAEKNLRIGGLIIADNVFLSGAVYGESNSKFSAKQVEVMRKFNQRLSDPNYYFSCFIPTPEGLMAAVKKF